ncbi:MAG: DEAD/DEAH box helicase [Christensenellales bacterium]
MMAFNPGQQVVYDYDNRTGTITGLRHGDRWQVKFNDGENMYIPEIKLTSVIGDDMFSSFSAGRFQGIDDLKRIVYRYRLSGELTNILYSMSNGATKFMPHQFIPVTKFLESYTDRLLIADEVGLGKTIESMYLWEELRVRKNANRLLIVVPAVLRFKWKSDLQKYFGIDAQIVSAQNSENGTSLLDYVKDSIMLPQKGSFSLIVSLEGLRIADNMKDLLEQNRDVRKFFDLVIIDEAHYLRNSNTRSFETGELLRDVAEGFLLLSATPIQTGSENFYNLLRLLSDEEFHDKSAFEWQLVENYPLVKLTSALDGDSSIQSVEKLLQEAKESKAFSSDADLRDLSDNLPAIMGSTQKRIATVAKLRSKYFYDGFVTRTRKRDVIENRTERKVASINYPLSQVGRAFYEQVTHYLKSKGDKVNAFNNFGLIMRQRQMASCMPAALHIWRAGSSEERPYDEDFSVFPEECLGKEVTYCSVNMPTFPEINLDNLIKNDAKLQCVLRMIQNLLRDNMNEKIVIFSFFRGTVNYLHRQLLLNDIRAIKILGGMKDNEKVDILNRFRDSNTNVLVSTEVASEGIDLQFAKYEINYDLPWNPMRLEQRIGRLDRIGQESPIIYIFNAFCEDTIEDRILSRLYERIQIFKDTIGDLEEIVGNVIQDLEMDVFLNDYQTDEDVHRKARQVEQTIENRRRITTDLEIKSGMFSLYQDFILSNIKEAHDSYRRITPGELIYTVRDFLNTRYPGSTVIPARMKDTALIKLSQQARDGLQNYIRRTVSQTSTSLCNEREETLCCFGSMNEGAMRHQIRQETIDINHPLIKWILGVIKNENAFSSCCTAVQVSKKVLPETLQVRSENYSFYIQQWIADGARRLNELHYFMMHGNGTIPLDAGTAEAIISAAALKGNTFDTHMLDDDTFARSVDCVNSLISYAWDQYDQFETRQGNQNNNLIKSQEQYIRRSTEKRIAGYRATIEDLRVKNRIDRVIRMWEGRVKHANEEMEDKLHRLNSKFDCPITCGDIAVGIIRVTE